MDITGALTLLNIFLKKKSLQRSFIICGGSSLILQGVISRQTKDIDVLAPPIDEALKEAAVFVAEQLQLDKGWLNTGPDSLIRDLPADWKERVVEVFKASHLVVYSIGRRDLLFSKFRALCDRQKDMEDIIALKPTKEELEIAANYTMDKDGNPDWGEWVTRNLDKVKRKMGYE